MEHRINFPTTEEEIRKLKAGDTVLLSGTIFTARDAAHKYMVEQEIEENIKAGLENSAIYHCGPIVKKNGEWNIVAAGPTTSIREEPYEAKVIEKYKVRAIIGKGGMGNQTLGALKQHGVVYLSAVGGAAALLANSIIKVKNVFKLEEFGIPEAFWQIEIKDFPTIVTMDSKGGCLHTDVIIKSQERYKELIS